MRGGLGAALLFFLLTWALCFGAGAVRGFAPAVDGLDFACLADSITRFHAYTWGETPPPIAQLPKKRVPLEPCAEYEPLHPGFLAAADALGGRWAYLVLASALVAGGMLLWWRAAQGWCAPGSLLPWALWLLLLYPNLIYHQARTYYREPLFTFLTALMAFLLSRAWASRRRGDCLAAGVAWGLAILTKSVWLALVPVLAWAWWRGVPEGRRLRLACFGWMMGACVAVVAPWTVRNLLVLKSPVLVSSLGGVGFMVNLVDHVNVWRTPRAGGDGGIPPEVRAGRIPDEAGIDKAIYRHKLARLASDPGLAVRIVGVNALCLLYPIVQAGAHALNPSLLFAYAGLGLLLLAWRRWRLPAAEDPRVVPVLLMGVYVGVSLVWQAQPGYRTPVEPLILLAGLLGWDIWIRAGRSLPRCGAAVAVYALAWGARLLWMSSWKTAVVAWLRGVCVR